MEEGLLQKSLPVDIDCFDTRAHHSTVFKSLFERIAYLGGTTTEYLKRCAQEDTAYDSDVSRALDAGEADAFFGITKVTFVGEEAHVKCLRKLFDAWFVFFLEHWEVMHDVNSWTIEDEFQAGTNKPLKIRTTIGTSVFTELTRLFYLLHRPQIVMEMAQEHVTLSALQHDLWISIERTFDISNQYQEKEDRDQTVESRLLLLRQMWERPIIEYSQSECVLLLFFLTQQINSLKQTCIDEFHMVAHALWFRLGHLVQKSWPDNVLDEPSFRVHVAQVDAYLCNRDFMTFISFYMGEIMRRFYYFDLTSSKTGLFSATLSADQIEALGAHVKLWVERFVGEMPDEAFRDMYTENCNEAYNYPGDDRWFKYKWPIKVHTRSECIRLLRPHLYRLYHSEDRTTKRMCLLQVQESHTSRTFVLKALNSYIHTKSGGTHIDWFGRSVIFSRQVAAAQYELMSNESPQLVQILSSFWAYDRKELFMTDNIFVTIGVWFLVLYHRYKGRFYGNPLDFFIQEAIPKNNGLLDGNLLTKNIDQLISEDAYRLISSSTLRL